jgi:hypothetical protein
MNYEYKTQLSDYQPLKKKSASWSETNAVLNNVAETCFV